MPRVHLTRQFAQVAACPPGRPKIDFFDADQRGFMLEVRASGGKTFYQRYTDARGRERQFKLGPAEMRASSWRKPWSAKTRSSNAARCARRRR